MKAATHSSRLAGKFAGVALRKVSALKRGAVLLSASFFAAELLAQLPALPLEIRQHVTTYNLQSERGVPLSATEDDPPGSDGRAPTQAQQAADGLTLNPPSVGLFRGMVVFGGLAAPRTPQNLDETDQIGAENAVNINLPVGRANNTVVVFLRSAQLGAPLVSRQVSFLFGSIIPVPATDEEGELLTTVKKEDYWLPEPHSLSGHANVPYYWSPHAKTVFAIQPGPISITWRKAEPSRTKPADYDTNPSRYFLDLGNYYTLHTVNYVVSGSAAKTPRKIYWTEGIFRNLGKPVTVPSTIGAIRIVYNNNFPERTAQEYIAPGQTTITEDPDDRFQEKRTLWYDHDQNRIFAYNQEGRVFLELLGEFREDGVNRRHLGFEIVDVFRHVNPDDVTVELGERLTAWPDGRDDSHLFPEPIVPRNSEPFLYRQVLQGTDRSRYYATRETFNLNDVLVHWLEEGLVGLRWPLRLVRYEQVWPDDVSKYSHYLRPPAATDADARLTAVQIPTENVPFLEYQDPLDRRRGDLTEEFKYYSHLDASQPVHRALLRLSSGENVAFERVFSWFDENLKTHNLANTIATNLSAWNPDRQSLSWPDHLTAPRYVQENIAVGQRIQAPSGEIGSQAGEGYWAGHIRQSEGTSYHPGAYLDPFTDGFDGANRGAIIPVNAIPGKNTIEVWWFRKNAADLSKGFKTLHWPSVVGRYTLFWPSSPREIILASNDGTGGLPSLEAKGTIYYQNDPAAAGYNPNEEHALMIAGQGYALRDDLNITLGENYSSEPYVLIEYTEADGRLAISPFKVLREKPSAGILFDYITEAGQILQAPMPLPLLPKPIEGAGQSARNFNSEPMSQGGNPPSNWNDAVHGIGPYKHYKQFTYEDRKGSFWVYRGFHYGPFPLEVGTLDSGFRSPRPARAVVGQPFSYTIHASRRAESLVMEGSQPNPLPSWLRINGLKLEGLPAPSDVGERTIRLVITGTEDGWAEAVDLSILVVENETVVTQGPMEITTSYPSGMSVTFVDRPPLLAEVPENHNSFSMRFYYRTQEGFAWPGRSDPGVGAIVPYLRPRDSSGEFVGDATSKDSASLEIVYRPVWPARTPTLRFGETLTTPKLGLPAIRGQSSLQILYQQSIARYFGRQDNSSATLFDPTREKTSDLQAVGLERLPVGIRTDPYQGKIFFPGLPPHLEQRIFFDPNRGQRGHLVVRGEFRDEPVGEKYLLLNLLQTDLTLLERLCPESDLEHSAWLNLVHELEAKRQTFHEDLETPGTYIPKPAADRDFNITQLIEIDDDDSPVDSYALSANGPGEGYVVLIAGNGRAFTPPEEPVSILIIRVGDPLYPGELKIIPSANPLDEQITLQHTADMAGAFHDYEYEWKISPPVDGAPPPLTPAMTGWTDLALGFNLPHYTLGGAGIQVLTDNYLVMRYRPYNVNHPRYNQWSDWTQPQLAEGWIKRVLAGINPFNQRINDLFNNRVNTDVSLLTQAGQRWEGDVALNLENIDDFGLIEIYETVLHRGKMLSIEAGINYGPANDALLLAAGYLNDLYVMIGNEASADAANPTIGIGTKDRTYGDIATALFAFKGQVPSVLEEELALLRGRDDFLQPGVETAPVYNRLFWNYTRGIDAGEVIYALNYNIQEDQDGEVNGVVNADDARKMFPQGHGDAYGHYLAALKGYYSLLMDTDFDWVPRTEAVTVLGKPVQVDYLDERKFAASALALARAGHQIVDLTWRKDYQSGKNRGWQHFAEKRENPRRSGSTRYWGLDHWASRAGQGALLHWAIGNAILPDQDPDSSHEGIQKIDRMSVPELKELALIAEEIQTSLDNAEAGLLPLGLPETAVAFDINPTQVVGGENATHFDQIYQRAKGALNNALIAFDDAKDVTRLMRSETDSLAELQASVDKQELAYEHRLIELFGTPYPEDIGPGRTFRTGYEGPDLIHYMFVDKVELERIENESDRGIVFKVDKQVYPSSYFTGDKRVFDFVHRSTPATIPPLGISVGEAIPDVSLPVVGVVSVGPLVASLTGGKVSIPARQVYSDADYISYPLDPHGFFKKPSDWEGKRLSPGKLQESVENIILAHGELKYALESHLALKYKLDRCLELLDGEVALHQLYRNSQLRRNISSSVIDNIKAYAKVWNDAHDIVKEAVEDQAEVIKEALPVATIIGLAAGGDLTSPARAAVEGAGDGIKHVLNLSKLVRLAAQTTFERVWAEANKWHSFYVLDVAGWEQSERSLIFPVDMMFTQLQLSLHSINENIRKFDAAQNQYRALIAQGNRLQQEREIFRQRTAALIQGYRTRDAAFRIFRNEKLERYKTLFDLAAQYAFLAAQAYDYETGLLGTSQGKQFLNRIVSARALGVVNNGEPQYAGSNTGDPGLSSALAEMRADWQVLKGRLGFNNPDAYGTTVSLRTENHRILPGTDGTQNWRDLLQSGRRAHLLADPDIRRYCMQLDSGDGLPVPGIVLEFSTTIADKHNLFGKPLAAGDHHFDPSSFATKIFGVGVAFEGYIGMDNPSANSSAVTTAGGTSPTDPGINFLDPKGLSATPYVYLIPVGLDSMRSPPLGDVSVVRTWSVDDITVPMPFNIGDSSFSTKQLWQSSDSLSEPLFGVRKHQAFRPVSTTSAFNQDIFGFTGQITPSQFTNRRLIGRSVWNSKWKLVIPGNRLLNDSNEGLDRFIQTVKDVKLHFVTYSYSGN